MKNNTSIKHSLIYLACVFMLGCSGSSGNNNSQTTLGLQDTTTGSDVEAVDIYTINDKPNVNKKSDQTCFEDRAICVTQGTEFVGEYVKIKDDYTWLKKDVSGHFDIDLDKSKVKSGSIKISKLSADLNGLGVQGHISELDDTSCNIDMNNSDDSCIVKLTYSADTPNNNLANVHSMQISWLDNAGKEHSGTVTFKTYNMFKTNQSVPILVNNNPVLLNPPNIIQQQGLEGAQLTMTNYIIGQLFLMNVGDDVLSDASKIKPLVSSNTHYFNLNDLSYYNVDKSGQGFIKCPENDLRPGGICSLNFTYKDYLVVNTFDSQVGRIAFKYKLDPTESDFYLYNNKYIISPGLFATNDYTVTVSTGVPTTISLVLSRLYNLERSSDLTSISYKLPIEGLKISIEPADGIYIPYYFDKDHIYYTLNDENKAYVNKLSVSFSEKDMSIFESTGVDYMNSVMYTAQISKAQSFYTNSLMGGLLVANYFVPELNKNIRQIIGTITIKNKENVIVDPSCKNVWRDNEFQYFEGCLRNINDGVKNHVENDVNIKIPLTGANACDIGVNGYCKDPHVIVGTYPSTSSHIPLEDATGVLYSRKSYSYKMDACMYYDPDFPGYINPFNHNDKPVQYNCKTM